MPNPHPMPKRLNAPYITLGGYDLSCFANGIHLVGDTDDEAATFCDPEGYVYSLALDLKMSYGPGSLDEALWAAGGPGAIVEFEFAYTDDTASESNPHWTGKVRIPPWPIVDATINGVTSFTITAEVIDGDITRTPEHATAVKGSTAAGAAFPTDPDITASDDANAKKLVPKGYIPADATVTGWPPGSSFAIGTYAFHWDVTEAAWAPGTAL